MVVSNLGSPVLKVEEKGESRPHIQFKKELKVDKTMNKELTEGLVGKLQHNEGVAGDAAYAGNSKADSAGQDKEGWSGGPQPLRAQIARPTK